MQIEASSYTNDPVDRILSPFRAFMRLEASGGILLLIAAIVALVWANSPWHADYFHLWEIHHSISLGSFHLSKPLHIWINDGLMAMFFFVVGLELKREALAGELSTVKKAMLPVIAALGGMVMPALLYYAANKGTPTADGWGIPMATDIAFALGILTLLGNRVPLALKVFLTALAIADDLGAVLVIAIFYTAEVSTTHLYIAGGILSIMIIMNMTGVLNPIPYAVLGIGGLWMAFLFSGIHPTIASILAAFTIPARRIVDQTQLKAELNTVLDVFEKEDENTPTGKSELSALYRLRQAYYNATTPLQRLEKGMHPWVVFLILPVFALANAGVRIEENPIHILSNPAFIGIVLGLVFGKQIGICLFTWLAVKLNLASLPKGVTWMHIYGVSWLAGVGFTMSIFIATLAFPAGFGITESKVGILTASLISGFFGWLTLHFILRNQDTTNTR